MSSPATPPPPLPRSLVPLAEESLSGFVLRLAHHLDLTPGNLLRRVGLATTSLHNINAPNRHLLMPEPAVLQAFATATRLSEDEARALTLHSLFGRCPVVTGALTGPDGSIRPAPLPRQWLFPASSRYCPHCLAGDSSDIQSQHGGPWKLQWRLAMVFACLEHNVLLEDRCPSCRAPAGSSGTRGGPIRLVPQQWATGLHPVQCRAIIKSGHVYRNCGHRFDATARQPPRVLAPELAELQRRILDLMAPGADQVTAFASLGDLRVMAAVVCGTWPAAAVHAPFDLPTGLNARISTTTAPDGRFDWSNQPPDSALTAAVLALADSLLSQPRPTFRKNLGALMENGRPQNASGWHRTMKIAKEQCTPTTRFDLQHALVQRFPYTARAPLRFAHALPARDHGYLPEHIPQWLPGSWFAFLAEHAAKFNLNPTKVRHTAAVHLARAATNTSFPEAAQFLGIPTTWFTGRNNTLDLRVKAPATRASHLQRALEALAEHITTLWSTIDYDRRRQHLAFWHLRPNDWQSITDQLPPQFTDRPPDLIHQCASAYTWATATGSDWSLAPCFRPPFTTHDQPIAPTSPAHRILNLIHHSPESHWRSLHEALSDHAEDLVLHLPATSTQPRPQGR